MCLSRWFQYKDEEVYIKPSSIKILYDHKGNGWDKWAMKVDFGIMEIDVGVTFDLIRDDLYLVEDQSVIEKIESFIEAEEAKDYLLNA